MAHLQICAWLGQSQIKQHFELLLVCFQVEVRGDKPYPNWHWLEDRVHLNSMYFELSINPLIGCDQGTSHDHRENADSAQQFNLKKKKLKNWRLVYFFTSAPLIYMADLYNCTDTSNGIIKNG